MTRKIKRWLILMMGWSLVVLGVAGLFLPFLQGVLFLLAGLYLLSLEYVWAQKVLRKLKDRFPTLSSRMDTAREKARIWLKRVGFSRSDKAKD